MADNPNELKITDEKEKIIIHRYRTRQAFYKEFKKMTIFVLIILSVTANVYHYFWKDSKDMVTPEGLYSEAMNNLKSNNYGQAKKYFTELIKNHPEDNLAGIANNEVQQIKNQITEDYQKLTKEFYNADMDLELKASYCNSFLQRYEGETDDRLTQVKEYQKIAANQVETKSWNEVTNNQYQIKIKIPREWKALKEEKMRYCGEGGYIFVETKKIPQYLSELVEREKSCAALYGDIPTSKEVQVKKIKACLDHDRIYFKEGFVINSSPELSEACIVIRYPSSVKRMEGTAILIHTTTEYADILLNGISFF